MVYKTCLLLRLVGGLMVLILLRRQMAVGVRLSAVELDQITVVLLLRRTSRPVSPAHFPLPQLLLRLQSILELDCLSRRGYDSSDGLCLDC